MIKWCKTILWNAVVMGVIGFALWSGDDRAMRAAKFMTGLFAFLSVLLFLAYLNIPKGFVDKVEHSSRLAFATLCDLVIATCLFAWGHWVMAIIWVVISFGNSAAYTYSEYDKSKKEKI